MLLLLLMAAALCLSDRDSLGLCVAVLLIVLVGGWILPDPDRFAHEWFLLCGLMELSLIFMAIVLRAPGSKTVAALSAMALICHAAAHFGYQSSSEWYDLYGPTIRAIEYTQILACAIFSPPMLRGVRWLIFGRRRKGTHYERRYKLA